MTTFDCGWFYIVNIASKRLNLCDDGEPYAFNDRFLARDLCGFGESLVYITDSKLDAWKDNDWTMPTGWVSQRPEFDHVDPATANLNDLI